MADWAQSTNLTNKLTLLLSPVFRLLLVNPMVLFALLMMLLALAYRIRLLVKVTSLYLTLQPVVIQGARCSPRT